MNFVSVDCGKFDTKTAYLTPDGVKRFKLRTKIGRGNFADDNLKQGTMVVQVDGGEVYAFGYGAKQEASMETSKMSEPHRIGVLASVAAALGPGVFDEVSVCIGMPLNDCTNVDARLAYKDFIFGRENEGEHVVRWRCHSSEVVNETRFTIVKRYVYPEGCGVLWLCAERCQGSTAIIDIGNLNTNCIYAEGLEPEESMCFTGELGGKALISGLAQTLSADLGARVAESQVAATLLRKGEERCLIPSNGDEKVKERSRLLIADGTKYHVSQIKQQCDIHKWPLAFAQVVCVGGTVRLIGDELREVFGVNVFIPENAEYVNAEGFLRRMCASQNVDVNAVRK